ncbi:MAG: hypothetical protein JXB00_13795 [Bacteroidales bacterium]|nr:hypothetical protein [Bacteroidales bacterium]
MKIFFYVCFLIFLLQPSFSQDKIFKTDKELFDCNIISVDTISKSIKYSRPDSGEHNYLSIPVEEIKYINYRGNEFITDTLNFHEFIIKVFSLVTSYNFISRHKNMNDDFIFTYSGKVYTGDSITFSNTEDGLLNILIDKITLLSSNVKFFKYNDQLWANTQRVHFLRKNNFARRVHGGRINYYERNELDFNSGINELSLQSSYMTMIYTVNKQSEHFTYYNKGVDNLKKVNYENLIVDLNDNAESMNYLQQSRVLQFESALLFIGGVGTMIYGFSQAVKKNNPYSAELYRIVPFVSVGLVAVWGAHLLSEKKSKKLKRAIEIYSTYQTGI